jgi:D-3-phosphoglycerate dehydrogenase / 2-oxoglutarate reductase
MNTMKHSNNKPQKIAVITPILHLKGVYDLLLTKGDVFLLEKGNKYQVKKLLLEENINVIICNPNHQNYKIDKELLDDTQVSIINSCSTGLNHIDLDYCKKNNIEIQCHKNDYELINQLPSTSELAFGLMLSLLRNIPECNNHVSNYNWDYTQFMGRQIKDLKIGIIGYGRLGKMMFNYCKSFGAKIKVYDPYKKEDMDDSFLLNYYSSSLEDLFQECDVISLHVHVTDETKYMVNQKLLGLSKKGLYLINTSRGEIVNEEDIVQSLNNKNLLGYGTDVIEDEFNDITNSPIIKAMNEGKNIIITPHVGGMTIEGQTKAYKWSINKL